MSRIGRKPVEVAEGVKVSLNARTLLVEGPKGELRLDVHPEMSVEVNGEQIAIHRPSDSPRHRALHGLTRSLVANMVEGVTNGFSKVLEIVGVGYRAEEKPEGIVLQLGYSHPIHYAAPEGIQIQVPAPTRIVVSGIDKQKVGQVAAEIRSFRPPEPYKGKGVRYEGEHVRRKAGKTAGT